MAIQNTTNATSFKNISDFVRSNFKHFSMLFSFFVLLVGLFFAHKLWVIQRERAAQYDFSALMTEYETMSREADPEWAPLLEKFEQQYAKHSNSSLLPYYLGYKVQILLHQDKRQEALDVLNGMITNMAGSSLVALYEMQRALIQLDSENGDLQQSGLQILQALADDHHNVYRDSAQYHLGNYYWAHNQMSQAYEVWQKLVDEQRDEKMAPSPWAQQVQEQLALTIV